MAFYSTRTVRGELEVSVKRWQVLAVCQACHEQNPRGFWSKPRLFTATWCIDIGNSVESIFLEHFFDCTSPGKFYPPDRNRISLCVPVTSILAWLVDCVIFNLYAFQHNTTA